MLGFKATFKINCLVWLVYDLGFSGPYLTDVIWKVNNIYTVALRNWEEWKN